MLLLISLLINQALALNTEIQFDLCPPNTANAVKRFELDSDDYKTRKLYLFDNDRGSITEKGVVLRLRVREEKATFTIKIRNLNPKAIPAKFFSQDDFKCEYDQHGPQTVLTCSLGTKLDLAEAHAVTSGKRPWTALQTSIQKEFLDKFSTLAAADRADVKVFGPAAQKVWEFELEGLSDDMSLEYTKAENFVRLEFSARVPERSAPRLAAALTQELKERGIAQCPKKPAGLIDFWLKKQK